MLGAHLFVRNAHRVDGRGRPVDRGRSRLCIVDDHSTLLGNNPQARRQIAKKVSAKVSKCQYISLIEKK